MNQMDLAPRVIEIGTKDASKLREFILRAWQEAGPNALGWSGATDSTIQELSSQEHLESLLSDPGLKAFVCEDDGKIRGFAVSRRVDASNVELAGIIVIQNELSRGFGSKLFEAVREYAIKSGFQRMIVKTESFNQRAVSFYKDRGFVEVEKKLEDVQGKEVELLTLCLDLM